MSLPLDTVCGRNLMIVVIAANRVSAKVTIMKEPTNNTSKSENEHEESTYALLIRSEEKRRNLIEMTLYSFLILGAVIAIWQFAQQPVDIPTTGLKEAACVVCVDQVKTVGEARHSKVKG
jgi:hypothetical protein